MLSSTSYVVPDTTNYIESIPHATNYIVLLKHSAYHTVLSAISGTIVIAICGAIVIGYLWHDVVLATCGAIDFRLFAERLLLAGQPATQQPANQQPASEGAAPGWRDCSKTNAGRLLDAIVQESQQIFCLGTIIVQIKNSCDWQYYLAQAKDYA